MNFNKSLIYCLLVSMMLSCSGPDNTYRFENSEDDDEIIGGNGSGTTDLVIDPQFQSYYDNFIAEMLSRDVDLRDVPISITFINPNFQPGDVTYCGLGFTNYNGTTGNASVEIVNSGYCWSNLTNIEKENLMYHEFGHALIERFHLSGESIFPNGSARSIMCSGNTCSGFSIYGNYQDEQRDFYLDELINEDINMPNWANSKYFNTTLADDSILENADGWMSGTENMSSTINPYSYFIDDNESFSASYSLGVTSVSNSQSNTFGNWYKDYEISDFEACSNLIATAKFKLTDILVDGYLNLYIDLFDDVNSETKFNRYYAESEVTDAGNGYYSLRSTAICIPSETVKFRVRLVLKNESNVTVYFDDIKVDLYD